MKDSSTIALSAVIDELEQNPAFYEPEQFVERVRALDTLEFHLPDEDALSAAEQAQLRPLRQKLEAANERLFTYLLERIHAHDWAAVNRTFQETAQQLTRRTDDETDYDE